LRNQPPGHGGEIQLADAINTRANAGKVQAVALTGDRYDCGSKFGYLQEIFDFALDDPKFGADFRRFIAARAQGLAAE